VAGIERGVKKNESRGGSDAGVRERGGNSEGGVGAKRLGLAQIAWGKDGEGKRGLKKGLIAQRGHESKKKAQCVHEVQFSQIKGKGSG